MASVFILDSDHKALKYIQAQQKLHSRHAKWVEYLQSFYFTVKHKFVKPNRGAEALSIRYLLLFQLDACIMGLSILSPFMRMIRIFRSFIGNAKGIQKGTL